MNAPYIIWVSLKVIERLEKSTPPKIRPIKGVKILFTKLVTMEEKAPPTITPTAKSKTLPRAINFLNSFIILPLPRLFYHKVLRIHRKK